MPGFKKQNKTLFPREFWLFPHEFWELNSGSCACKTSILQTELSLQRWRVSTSKITETTKLSQCAVAFSWRWILLTSSSPRSQLTLSSRFVVKRSKASRGFICSTFSWKHKNLREQESTLGFFSQVLPAESVRWRFDCKRILLVLTNTGKSEVLLSVNLR